MSEKSKLSSKFCTNGGGDVMTGVPKDGGEIWPAGPWSRGREERVDVPEEVRAACRRALLLSPNNASAMDVESARLKKLKRQ